MSVPGQTATPAATPAPTPGPAPATTRTSTRRPGPATRVRVRVVDGGRMRTREEQVTTEEPLEIRVDQGDGPVRVTVTMRTPGHDFELAAGFLHGEGVLADAEAVRTIRYCTDVDDEQRYNVVTVDLAHGGIDLSGVVRRQPTTSACGVCGSASLDDVRVRCPHPLPDGPVVTADALVAMPDLLRPRQKVFDRTGGLHAAGLFTPAGEVLAVREDVGRHNAVDKLVGWALMQRRLPLHDCVLVVSGRAGFEIVQKAVAAGVPVVASVSAPSSLAVDLARDRGLTLAGFVREGRLTLYSGATRVSV